MPMTERSLIKCLRNVCFIFEHRQEIKAHLVTNPKLNFAYRPNKKLNQKGRQWSTAVACTINVLLS
jgi:hypothetical protein